MMISVRWQRRFSISGLQFELNFRCKGILRVLSSEGTQDTLFVVAVVASLFFVPLFFHNCSPKCQINKTQKGRQAIIGLYDFYHAELA